MKSLKFYIAVILSVAAATLSSCTDLLDADAKDILPAEDAFATLDNADSAIRGIYGQLSGLAASYVVLNELRADLMDVTINAQPELRALSLHQELDNYGVYADPRPYFSLINNCNDVLKNFERMYNANILSREQYNARYADIVAVRSWTYLQVVLHFADKEKGGVPYFTEPLVSVEDLSDENLAKFEYLGIEEMVETLLETMEALPIKTPYTDANLTLPVTGYNSSYMYIDKEYLLGELNLWAGNYNRAAQYFKNIMVRNPSGRDAYDVYKIAFDASATLGQTSSRYNSGYIRYYTNDRASAKNMWPYMFLDNQTTNYGFEWLWALYFDGEYVANPFTRLFSNLDGDYLIKPSALAINNWDNQVQHNGFEGDFRGSFPNAYGPAGSYVVEGGQPVALKHIMNSYYTENTSANNEKQGQWHLWRAGSLHLRFCEAANRDGQPKVAYALMNNGIGANYPSLYPSDLYPEMANNYTDSTLWMQTGLPFPYDFDARMTQSSDNPPMLRQPWFRNTGLRNRVFLQNRTVVGDSIAVIEDQLLEESALELAFEGQRWPDLVRIAVRRGDNAILANKIAAKLNMAGEDGEAARAKLMDRSNWFLPLR